MGNCIKCGKESKLYLSPDIDIRGFCVCKKCEQEVKMDLMMLLCDVMTLQEFNEKYYGKAETQRKSRQNLKGRKP